MGAMGLKNQDIFAGHEIGVAAAAGLGYGKVRLHHHS